MRRMLPLIVVALIVTVGLMLAHGAAHAVTMRFPNVEAQQTALSAPNGRSAQKEPPAKAAPPRVPERTETLNLDNWVVTCRQFADAPKKRICNAQLRAEQSGSARIILVWTMFINDKKKLVAVLQTLTGVMIAPGVELQLGSGPKHKFAYESCEPDRCLATRTLDSAFIREASAASKAAVNVRATNGNTVTINFPIKGFAKAYAQLKTNAS